VRRLGFLLLLAALFALPASAVAKPGLHPHKGGGKAKAKPALAVAVVKPPTLTAGTSSTLSVRVQAKGKAAVTKIVVKAVPSAGVTVTPAKAKIKRLGPHKKKILSFQVGVERSATAASVQLVTTAAKVKKTTTSKKLAVTPAPVVDPNGPAGHYFWRTELILNTTYMKGYYFVDDKWVYRGIPDGGLPSCSGATAQGEDDGCLPYTYDPATGALNINGVGGEYKVGSHLLKVDDFSFSEAFPIEAGSKFDASGQHINGFGICPLSCSFVSVGLELTAAGSFARSAAVSGTFPEGSFAALPPDQHGSYAIDQRGRIVFTYADGHVVTETIASMGDKNENPDPNYGLILDDAAYFGPHSDV
jgi:hypothetical protein